MYSTCLFCMRSLGHNSLIPSFPVGTRLAFDSAQGRLWATCKHCGGWNLTPVETRWEAIEECERLYRTTPTRIATNQIGLAQVRDGTELIRIGKPLRSEFAAWRYGAQFAKRRTKQVAIAGVGLAAAGSFAIAGLAVGASVLVVGVALVLNGHAALYGRPRSLICLASLPDGDVARIRMGDLTGTRLVPDSLSPFALELAYEGGRATVTGSAAANIAAILFRHVNRYGAPPQLVQDSVVALGLRGTPDAYLRSIARIEADGVSTDSASDREQLIGSPVDGLFALSPVQRLACEMALNETSEWTAGQAELRELEQRWREAEEIAAIADNLFVPKAITDALERLRTRA